MAMTDHARLQFFAAGLVIAAGWLATAHAGATPKDPRFEPDILPLFRARCLPCHDAKTRQGGLSLETRDDILKGGKTGAAAVPGKPIDSLILTMVSSGRMPAGGSKLSGDEILTIRRWIESGALKQGEQSIAATVSEREVLTSILGAKCFPCHGRRTQQGGLDLRTRASILKGGKSGPAMVPGKPDESLIVKRILSQEMPPSHLQEQFSVRGLTSDELEKLRQWIAAGAPEDGDNPIELRVEADPLVSEKDRNFWSFRPPQRPRLPDVRQKDNVRNPIDAFLLEKLEAKGLGFSEEADRRTLIRRAYFDLVGLPPSPEDVQAFLADRDPQAYENLIDRLLASPHYGERWARYWLDAAGYADSEGGVSSDNVRPFAYRYRDYVIRALNQDKPYDQFLIEQIAGDELFDYKATEEYSADQLDKLVATGFLRMVPDPTYSTEQNFIPERLDTVASEIEVLSSVVMGLTIGCARCHDHKYDPIPQRDYYRLSAIFRTSLDPWDWLPPSLVCVGVGAKCDESNTRYLTLRSSRERREVQEHNAPIQKKIEELEKTLETRAAPLREQLLAKRLAALPKPVQDDLRKAVKTPENQRAEMQRYLIRQFKDTLDISLKDLQDEFKDFSSEAEKLNQQIQAEKKKLKPPPLIRALFDMGGEPTPTRLLLRGEFANPGPLVDPGVPSVLAAGLAPYQARKPDFTSDTSGRRLALARWLVQPNHPLTGRAMVNRLWQYHFGEGLVRSPGNFGRTGMSPSHPELLDWLATEFVRRRWSVKAMHRLIMTSAAYRQSSSFDAAKQAQDPGNILLSGYPIRRLDAEALRDSMLKVAGRLDPTPFGPPVEIEVLLDGEVVSKAAKAGHRRSIYLIQRRSKPITMLEVFDAPRLGPNCLKRGHSTVSSQALQLMNSELVRESARYMAGRIIDSVGDDVSKQVVNAYMLALSRTPSETERPAAEETLRAMTGEWRKHLDSNKPAEPVASRTQWLALASLCHTILNSAEFLYVD